MSARQTGASARRRARRLALQAVYQWQMNAAPAPDLEAEFRAGNDMRRVDGEFFHDLLCGVIRKHGELDEAFAPLLDREPERLTPVERAVLRLAAYELLHCPGVPWRVAVSEGVELARQFGAEGGHKFVNGVLDRLARTVRADEISASGQPGPG